MPGQHPVREDIGSPEPAEDLARPYQESDEVAQAYERVREAFLAWQAAYRRLEQAHAQGRFYGPESEEYYARSGDLRELARLARLLAAAEIERFAERRAALRPNR